MRWGEARGAPLQKVEPAPSQAWSRQLWTRQWDLRQAWRGVGGYPGAARLAASGEEEPPGAGPVRLRRDGGPQGSAEKLPPRPQAPLPTGLAGSPSFQAGNATVFFFFPPKKEAPGSHSFSEVGVDVCLAGGGRETSPLQAPSLFPQTGVSLCKIGSFPEPPFSHL